MGRGVFLMALAYTDDFRGARTGLRSTINGKI